MNSKKIGCIVMASGFSTRFGSNKLLVNYKGKPLVQNIIEKLKILGLPLVVVTRYPEVQDLCARLQVDCVIHNYPYQNDTVRLGLEHLSSLANFDGFLFCTSDQPLLEAATLNRLLHSFTNKPDLIHRLSYNGIPGNPVIFPCRFLPQLLKLPLDQGGNYIVRQNKNQLQYTEADFQYELFDVDTFDDLEKLNHL